MHRKYLILANASLATMVAAIGTAAYLGQGSSTASIWGPGGAPGWLAQVAGFCVILSFWAYARAKGRSGWLGVLLPLLSVIGLIILLRLEDHSGRAAEIACAKCGGKNFAADTACRYCQSALQAVI